MSFDLQISNSLGNFALLQHDVSYDSIGRLITVSGVTKLEQDIQKILVTSKNYFYNQYGTSIQSLIGQNLNPETIVNNLNSQVTNALNYLIALQGAQARYQTVNATETIKQIVSIKVNYAFALTNNPADLTRFLVAITVQNAAGQNVSVNRNINLN